MSNLICKYFKLAISPFNYVLIANAQSKLFDIWQFGARGSSKTLLSFS
jgi:hypothetical protein